MSTWDEVEEMGQALRKRNAEVEQLRVQLAGCGAAALGWTSGPVIIKPDDYGWSPAYQDTLVLRRKYEKALELLKEYQLCGAEIDDRRMGYKVIQVPYAVDDEVREFLSPPIKEEKDGDRQLRLPGLEGEH